MKTVGKASVRDNARKAILSPGTIFTSDCSFECVVVNLSAQGAGVCLETDAEIPTQFALKIKGDNSIRLCRILWRVDRRIGVLFTLDKTALQTRTV